MRFRELLEGKNVPCIVVDIQPAYSKYMNINIHDLCHFLAKQSGPFLMFVNSDETGLTDDNITYDILPWWDEQFEDSGLDFHESAFQKMIFVDKGYGYFRGWMDRNVPDRFIIQLIRYMYQNGLNDIQDDLDGVYESMTANPINIHWESWMNEEPFSINWTSVSQLKEFNQCYIMGGGRNECLREVELLMNAFNIKYKRIDKFVY